MRFSRRPDAGEGAAQVAFPGDMCVLWKDAPEDSPVEEKDDDGDDGRAPAFHEEARGDEVGGQSVNQAARADVPGLAPADQPGSQPAAEPDERQRGGGSIAQIPEENGEQDEKRRRVGAEVFGVTVKKRAEENADQTAKGARQDAKLDQRVVEDFSQRHGRQPDNRDRRDEPETDRQRPLQGSLPG